MIWLALAFALTAWACVAAYGIWAWRDDRYAERKEKRDEQERTERSFERIQNLLRQWSEVRPPAQPPFPAEGDNFQTIAGDNVTPLPFGKKPRTEPQPDGAA